MHWSITETSDNPILFKTKQNQPFGACFASWTFSWKMKVTVLGLPPGRHFWLHLLPCPKEKNFPSVKPCRLSDTSANQRGDFPWDQPAERTITFKQLNKMLEKFKTPQMLKPAAANNTRNVIQLPQNVCLGLQQTTISLCHCHLRGTKGISRILHTHEQQCE